MSLISVIIPYFNKKQYIKEAVSSVLNQTYKNFEIIIIYDDKNLSDYNFFWMNLKTKIILKYLKIIKI